jgi:hypothetical protein
MAGADERNFSGEDLVRVVVLPNGCWFQGWKMQSVELFRDGIVIRAWRAGDWNGRDDSDHWEIQDELGTSYVWNGAGEDVSSVSTRLGQEFVSWRARNGTRPDDQGPSRDDSARP